VDDGASSANSSPVDDWVCGAAAAAVPSVPVSLVAVPPLLIFGRSTEAPGCSSGSVSSVLAGRSMGVARVLRKNLLIQDDDLIVLGAWLPWGDGVGTDADGAAAISAAAFCACGCCGLVDEAAVVVVVVG